VEDAAAIEPCIASCLTPERRGTRLSWPLDLRWAKVNSSGACSPSPPSFRTGGRLLWRDREAHRRSGSVRAVAQALRHNPLPIVIPCHRVIGRPAISRLCGHRIGLKEQLLTLEGVPVKRRCPPDRSQQYVLWIAPDKEYLRTELRALSEMPLAS